MSSRPRSLRVGDGLDAVADGITFILTRPKVWPYALVPVAILLALSCGLSILGFWAARETTNAILGSEVGTWGRIGGWMLTILMATIGVLLALVVGIMMAQPLSGPALERIVLARERALTGTARHGVSFLLSVYNTLKSVLLGLLAGGPILVLLFLISFFFPPAAVVTVPLKILVTGWMLAWDFIDYPLSMRGVGLDARLCWVGRNFLAFTFFGLAWATLLLVPGVFLFILPMGVCGAAYMVLQEERRQAPLLVEATREEALPAHYPPW